MNPKIVIILPAYNQEKNIEGLLKDVQKYVSNTILISDGSTDRTAEFAAKSGAIVPDPVNKRGKGNAVIRGIEFSKSLKPDIIILMDSDGQNNPSEIPSLVKPLLEEDYDMVIGSRFLGVIRTSFINKLGNRILNLLHFLITLRWISDVESGFRAFKADKLYSLNIKAPNYELESDVLLESIKNKLKIKEVPIKILKQEKGINFSDGFKILKFILKKRLKDVLI